MNDEQAIRAIVDRQFRSLEWSDGEGGAGSTFAGDFYPNAALFPSARPVNEQTVSQFVERMKGLSQTTLRSFKERMLGAEVRVFGSVAVAMAACELTENEGTTSRGVEALLLVRDEGQWKVVAQAWDGETEDRPIPRDLLSG